jgi:hypothetical protein
MARRESKARLGQSFRSEVVARLQSSAALFRAIATIRRTAAFDFQ